MVQKKICEEQDLNKARDPRVDIRVVRHGDFLVNPVASIKDAVETDGDDEENDAWFALVRLTVAEHVLGNQRHGL